MPNSPAIDNKGPAVKFPPPLIFIGFLTVGYGLQLLIPVTLGLTQNGKLIGSILTISALLILLLLLVTYLRAKTSIEPWKPTSKLITDGLYAHTRNPIYLMFCLINIGTGCYLNSLWVTLSFLPAAWLVYCIVIRKEEAYLTLKFGSQYLAYKNKVRRWL